MIMITKKNMLTIRRWERIEKKNIYRDRWMYDGIKKKKKIIWNKK